MCFTLVLGDVDARAACTGGLDATNTCTRPQPHCYEALRHSDMRPQCYTCILLLMTHMYPPPNDMRPQCLALPQDLHAWDLLVGK